MTTTPIGWDGILDDDETILWQGRPDSAVVWSDLISFESVFGLFFGGFALFWVIGAAAMTSGIPSQGGVGAVFTFFPLFGLPFLAVGLYMVVGRIFWDAFQRGRTWYTLTDRAAYIARDTFGKRSLKRYGLEDLNPPDLQDNTPGSVIFAEDISHYRSSSRRGGSRNRTTRTPVGFRRIPDARAVYRLLVDQRNAHRRAQPPE